MNVELFLKYSDLYYLKINMKTYRTVHLLEKTFLL